MEKKPLKLTPKQEKFAQLLATGSTQYEAYKKAYNPEKATRKTIDEMASRKANEHKIATRVAELKEPVEKILRKNAKKFANRIIEASDASEDDVADHRIRLKAAEIGLQYGGYEPPKKVVQVNVDMTQEELDDLLNNLD